MGVKQSFFLALKSLATSKMRALLTMLGIIIGVAAVIIIISLGDGMQKLMSDSFDELGANLIQVTVQSSGSSREVDTDDMYDLVEKNPSARTMTKSGRSRWSRDASFSMWTYSALRRYAW